MTAEAAYCTAWRRQTHVRHEEIRINPFRDVHRRMLGCTSENAGMYIEER